MSSSEQINWKSYLLYACHVTELNVPKRPRIVWTLWTAVSPWKQQLSKMFRLQMLEKHFQNLVRIRKSSRYLEVIRIISIILNGYLISCFLYFPLKSCYFNWYWILQFIAFFEGRKKICFSSFWGISAVEIYPSATKVSKTRDLLNNCAISI